MYNVFVTRALPSKGLDILRARKDVTLVVYPKQQKISDAELRRNVKGCHALLSLLTEHIDAKIMDAAGGELKIISNYAVGYDNIDLTAAKQRGIVVTNTPGVLTDAVAEHTIALMMALCRRIPEADQFVRKGKYKSWDPLLLLGSELRRKTLGIIGLGGIGSRVAEISSKGLGMHILYNDVQRNESFEKDTKAIFAPLNTILSRADVISVHVPLLPTTQHLINAEHLALMKPTAYLINTSRGPIIDEHALVTALTKNAIAGAALDVFEHEPKLSAGLATLTNVILTPHIASASIEAREEMSVLACQAILDVLDGKTPKFVVV